LGADRPERRPRPGQVRNAFSLLDRARPAFEKVEDVVLQECTSCGQVTTGAVCAFCKLADLVKRRTSPVQ
jgi:hypothetical protein